MHDFPANRLQFPNPVNLGTLMQALKKHHLKLREVWFALFMDRSSTGMLTMLLVDRSFATWLGTTIEFGGVERGSSDPEGHENNSVFKRLFHMEHIIYHFIS